MNISKIAILCGLSAAMSFAGITINVNTGNSKKKHHDEPPPPPPPVKLHHCDGRACCDVTVDRLSGDYDLSCSGSVDRVIVYIDGAAQDLNTRHNRGNLSKSNMDSRYDLRVIQRKPNFRTRLCDDGVCCDLDEDPYSFNYTFTCDKPYERANLLVRSNGRKENYTLSDRGRLNGELTSQDKVELRIKRPAPPPPPPPPPSGGVRRVHK